MAANRTDNIGLYAIIGAVLLIAVALVVFMPKRHNWSETLRSNKEEPYDLSVFKALIDSATIKELHVTEKSVTEELNDFFGFNYFFFGQVPYYDSTEISALFEFAERGNNVFIASNELPQEFYDECDTRWLWLGEERWVNAESVRSVTNAANKEHGFDYHGPMGFNEKWWNYIDQDYYAEEETTESYFEEEEGDSLISEFFTENYEDGSEEDSEDGEYETKVEETITYESTDTTYSVTVVRKVRDKQEADDDWQDFEQLGYFYHDRSGDTLHGNFFVAKVGKGSIFIHTNPILFSNYFLMSEEGFTYSNEVLSFLDAKPAIWDGYHQVYHFDGNDYQYKANTPLRFVFQHAPLKYAWFTLLGGTLLFLLFRSKREQKVIPIIPAVENTSIAFAKSLGVLYHQATSGRFLAVELMRMFDNFNRRQYRYNRNRKDENSAWQIAKKAKVKKELVDEILTLERQTIYNPISKLSQVFVLYNRLEDYYKQAKR